VRAFMEKRIGAEVPADTLGDEFKGYVFKITGGMDKQGVAMKQGVLSSIRVKLLMDGETGHYRPHRSGERRRKAVRGAIVGDDISVLNVIIVKKGEKDLPGLTDKESFVPRRLGPKRATKIRRLFNLSKEDDVRQFVIRRSLPKKEGKKVQVKAPKIQRLVTATTLRRKKVRLALKKQRFEKQKTARADYEKHLAQMRKDKRQVLLSKKRKESAAKSTGGSVAADAKKTAAAPAPAAAAAAATADTKAKKTGADKKKKAPAKKTEAATTEAAPAKATPAKAAPAKVAPAAAAPAKQPAPEAAAKKAEGGAKKKNAGKK